MVDLESEHKPQFYNDNTQVFDPVHKVPKDELQKIIYKQRMQDKTVVSIITAVHNKQSSSESLREIQKVIQDDRVSDSMTAGEFLKIVSQSSSSSGQQRSRQNVVYDLMAQYMTNTIKLHQNRGSKISALLHHRPVEKEETIENDESTKEQTSEMPAHKFKDIAFRGLNSLPINPDDNSNPADINNYWEQQVQLKNKDKRQLPPRVPLTPSKQLSSPKKLQSLARVAREKRGSSSKELTSPDSSGFVIKFGKKKNSIMTGLDTDFQSPSQPTQFESLPPSLSVTPNLMNTPKVSRQPSQASATVQSFQTKTPSATPRNHAQASAVMNKFQNNDPCDDISLRDDKSSSAQLNSDSAFDEKEDETDKNRKSIFDSYADPPMMSQIKKTKPKQSNKAIIKNQNQNQTVTTPQKFKPLAPTYPSSTRVDNQNTKQHVPKAKPKVPEPQLIDAYSMQPPPLIIEPEPQKSDEQHETLKVINTPLVLKKDSKVSSNMSGNYREAPELCIEEMISERQESRQESRLERVSEHRGEYSRQNLYHSKTSLRGDDSKTSEQSKISINVKAQEKIDAAKIVNSPSYQKLSTQKESRHDQVQPLQEQPLEIHLLNPTSGKKKKKKKKRQKSQKEVTKQLMDAYSEIPPVAESSSSEYLTETESDQSDFEKAASVNSEIFEPCHVIEKPPTIVEAPPPQVPLVKKPTSIYEQMQKQGQMALAGAMGFKRRQSIFSNGTSFKSDSEFDHAESEDTEYEFRARGDMKMSFKSNKNQKLVQDAKENAQGMEELEEQSFEGDVDDLRPEMLQNVQQPDFGESIQVYSIQHKGLMPQVYAERFKIAIGHQLGRGGQAVCLAVHLHDGKKTRMCVAKYNDVYNNEEEALRRFKQMYSEFALGCTIDHEFIIKTHYFIRKWEQGIKQKQGFYLILEKMDGGTLFDYLSSLPCQKEQNIQNVRRITLQITKALEYLHKNKIVHKDIKPENILLSKDKEIAKLIDLGVSQELEKTKWDQGFAGTYRYASPEMFDNRLTLKVDIWALGCIVLFMVSGQSPFHGIRNELSIQAQLRETNPLEYALQNYPEALTDSSMYVMRPEIKDFIERCFVIDHTKRWSPASLLAHPFLNPNIVWSDKYLENHPLPK